MSRIYSWKFPLPRTHTGMLQGNGLLGAMIWGEGSRLRISLGRSDLWDHRGGLSWGEQQSYAGILRCLESRDETGLRRLFEKSGQAPEGVPSRPSIIPVGRLDLDLGAGAELTDGEIDLETATVTVKAKKGKKILAFKIHLAADLPLVCVRMPSGLGAGQVSAVPSWKYIGKKLKDISFTPPRKFSEDGIAGWAQPLPVDPAVAVAYGQSGSDLFIAVERGEGVAAAKGAAVTLVRDGIKQGRPALEKSVSRWWKNYWRDVPEIFTPNANLQFIYDYGMYKFGAMTSPQGVAAGLQGPWIEEYDLPPWSGDYHFNINVQMCYWPAYSGNRLKHLRPLFDMIDSWLPTLRNNAKVFLGIDDGIMLPHAVDDRCVCMGGFWSGTIDHGCTAWVAQMMFDYYRYSGDEAFLRERAYPFMQGAMRVYEEMLEQKDGKWSLPVSVSPEYRGSSMDAWGKNASFQLACIHRLCEDLLSASDLLGEKPRAVWKDISKNLPRACVEGEPGRDKISLWEGTELEMSHRHHSHLAGIVPFDVIDPEDRDWAGIVRRSHDNWLYRGMGLWTGWCMPWASMLHTRLGNPDMAEMILDIWQRVFTNEGHGTLHDYSVPGFSLMGSTPLRREIMQMDAGMGAVTAIQKMLLCESRGVNYLFRGAPSKWDNVSFKGMLTAGAFLVGAARSNGTVTEVKVKSLKGGVFQLANPWDGKAPVAREGGKQSLRGKILSVKIKAGETLSLKPV